MTRELKHSVLLSDRKQVLKQEYLAKRDEVIQNSKLLLKGVERIFINKFSEYFKQPLEIEN